MQAGQLHAHYLAVRSHDSYGRGRRLLEQSESIFSALESFLDAFRTSLPAPATAAIEKFVERNRHLMTPKVGEKATADDALQERAWAALVLLAAFETEMSFLLADMQEAIRARSELAFLHLQRSLVVDEALRAAWRGAFDRGEVECERRGAVHLLLHGIWAFKVNAVGERTDLVFQELSDMLASAQRSGAGLVLTEWKKADPPNQAARRFEEAHAQAQRYAQGALGGIELTSVRYLIVVSLQQVTLPPDRDEAGVVYRHINIAVDPQVPSRA